MADYAEFDILDILSRWDPGCLDNFPALRAYIQRMAARPGVKAYRERKEIADMPTTGTGHF